MKYQLKKLDRIAIIKFSYLTKTRDRSVRIFKLMLITGCWIIPESKILAVRDVFYICGKLGERIKQKSGLFI